MSEPIFTTKYLGTTVKVFPTHVSYKFLLTEKSIPIKSIASVELGIPLHALVVVETTGGQKHKIAVLPGEKTKLRDAIYSQMS